MANRSEGFNERLAIAAVVLAGIAILCWVVPVSLTDASELTDSRLSELFSGLTDFRDSWPGVAGRMPAFLVAAFSSIFLLQLRRR
jgi:hypothetical protein